MPTGMYVIWESWNSKATSSDVPKKVWCVSSFVVFRSLKCPGQILSYDIIWHHITFTCDIKSHEMIWNIHNDIMTISWPYHDYPFQLSHMKTWWRESTPQRGQAKKHRRSSEVSICRSTATAACLHEIQVPGEKNRGAVIFFGGD